MEIPGKRRDKKNHARLSEILYKAAKLHSKLFNTMWILYLSLFLIPQYESMKYTFCPIATKLPDHMQKFVCALACFDLKK